MGILWTHLLYIRRQRRTCTRRGTPMVPQGVSHCLRIGQDGPAGMLPPPLDWKCDLEAAAEPATVLLMA